MENNLTESIENSQDELIILIRSHVEDIFQKFFEQSGILLDFDVRNDAVMFTYEKITKKWLNDSRFETKKDSFIRVIIKNYLFTMGLQS